MNSLLFYRIASGLLLFFSATHTYGLLSPKKDPQMLSVVKTMKSRFKFMGRNCDYYGFYIGFGLLTTLFLAFSSVLAWQLGDLSVLQLQAARTLTWPLMIAQAVTSFLSFRYFFAPPGVVSALATIVLALAIFI
jgi:hypothetical protein